MSVLDKINSVSDIKTLNIKELKQLAKDIRALILKTVEKNGGHLASNLGIVETTIALYYVFDFPTDKLIFDVGHQCYAHKILSGRKENFSSIRKDGGISGFPDNSESQYDSFIAGHAGTSIAAALGYCEARDKLGQNYSVINVVGDGALVNGLNLEALSYSNMKPTNLITILNDNGMSISKNKNGFYQLVSKSTTKRGYLGSKKIIKKIFGQSFVTRVLARIRNFVKRLISKSNVFENHGYKYVGVVDGNDITEIIKILTRVKRAANDKAVLLHIKTTKGKGYEKAEEKADVYHGVGENFKNECGSFSVALGEKLNELIETKDSKIVAITAGMKDGTGLSVVAEKNPKNFLDVGIAEEFAVTSAAGMAMGGLKPFVAIYSTFMQRAYDQLVHDVCLQNLPVVFCLDRAGLNGKDGKTHQGVFDLSYLLHVPNLSVFAPTTVCELKDILECSLGMNSPVVIRYPKNALPCRDSKSVMIEPYEILTEGEKLAIIAVGPRMLDLALKISKNFNGVKIINARRLKPLCKEVLEDIKSMPIVTLEENSVIGGFGTFVSGYFSNTNCQVKILNLGVKDDFVAHGEVANQLSENGLDENQVVKRIQTFLGVENE